MANLERFEEIKIDLKNKLSIVEGSYVENSNIAQIIDVLSYHYTMMESDNNIRYQNSFLDSVLYESDMISLLNQLGLRRESPRPNIAYLNKPALNRGEQYTGQTGGNIFNFYSFTNSNKVAEGSYNTWDFEITNLNLNNEFELINSERLYVNDESLKLVLDDSLQLNLSKEFTTINDPNYYYIYENTNGNYILRLNKTGTYKLEGFVVGSKESVNIKDFTRVSDGLILRSSPVSYGYAEKEDVQSVKKGIASKMGRSFRAVSISDFNRLGNYFFPNYNLYFYDEEDNSGTVYFSNKLDSELSKTQIDEVIRLFENNLMMPGIDLVYRYKPAIFWDLQIEVLLEKDLNNATNQSTINVDMLNELSLYRNDISLFKFMQTMYDKYENNIVDIKINKSVIQYIVNNKYIVDLKNIQGVISVHPYMQYTYKVNKIHFPVAYSGRILIKNVLSPVTFAMSDYIKIVPTIYFKEI